MTTRNGHARKGTPRTRKPAQRARESLALQGELVSQLQEIQSLLIRNEWSLPGGTTQHYRLRGRNYPFFSNEAELANLRAQSRIVWGVSSYARGLFEGLASYVLGDGLTYRATPKKLADPTMATAAAAAAQQVIDAHLEHNYWYGGEQPGVELEAFVRWRRDGEFILVHTGTEDGLVDCRFAEPDMLREPVGQTVAGFDCTFGVKTPIDDVARHMGYFISWDYQAANAKEYSPDDVTFVRCNVDRNVKRGLPDLVFDAADGFNAAAKLRNALGEGAAEQASIASVMEYENASVDQVTSLIETQADYQLRDVISGLTENIKRFKKGEHLHIPKGQKYVEAPSAANAPNHIAVLDMLLRSAGRAWNAPEWLTSGDASNNNYSSSLTAESPFVRRVKREQRTYCSAMRTSALYALQHYCQTRRLRVGAMELGWDDVRALVDVVVTAPSPETRDKLMEAQRDQIYTMIGAKSVQMVSEEQGYDPSKVQSERDEWTELNPDPSPLSVPPGFGGDANDGGGATPSEWQDYVGRYGGRGKINVTTGQIKYE